MDNLQQIKDVVAELHEGLLATYCDLHAHPELSFREWGSAERIAARLEQEGIAHQTIATTGVIAKIEGTAEGADLRRAVVLRADIDALPIEEATGLPYASTNRGVMHACGHDLHATILLGALAVLNRCRHLLGCTIFGLFQPGEELNPGGAKLVLGENPFEGYEVAAVVGNHAEPELKVGTVGICPGKYMAACDELHFTIRGRGGHAALRAKIVDPILPAAKLIEGLYAIPASAPEGVGTTIISIGRVVADGATNVVSDEVRMEGTMRTFDAPWREQIMSQITELCRGLEERYGVAVDNDFGEGYPAVYNNPELASRASALLAEVGEVVALGTRPTGEDFGYYSQRYPSIFYRVGVGRGEEGAAVGALHTATFAPATEAIDHGVVAMAMLGLNI